MSTEGPTGSELLRARAYLSAVAEAPAPALVRFVSVHGACVAARRVAEGEVPAEVSEEVDARRARTSGSGILESAEKAGLRLVVPEGHEWPEEPFAALREATAVGVEGVAEPLALWVRGKASAAELLGSAVSVVGARAASGYGETLAAEFGHALARAGFTVVSGAAYGIDGAAHRGALGAGRTMAFLACGTDADYPAGHSRLLRSIGETGLVVSEYPPGTQPRRHRFLVRNRLIAAAGTGTVVVEAGARSGAANTAGTAEALGRPVMAVPGPVTSAGSVGCHAMLRAGRAVLVTKPDEVVEVVAPMGTGFPAEAPVPQRPTDGLGGVAKRLYEALPRAGGGSAEELAAASGLPIRKVRAVLPALEMAGLAALGQHGWGVAEH